MLSIDGLNLPLLACFAGGPVLLIAAIRMVRKDRGVGILLGLAAVSLVGASGFFLAGNRRDEMAGIPHILMGALVFWGIFVPTLVTAFYVHRLKRKEHR